MAHGGDVPAILLLHGDRECAAEAEIDREERKGEKPSDHAPVIAVLGDET
jgi:exonuclease III